MNSQIKADFNPLQSNAVAFIIYGVLALLTIATRPYHFASTLNLPSASTAVFFICGLLGANHRTFSAFVVLGVAIDLVGSYVRGAFGDCITWTYPLLFVGYYLLWWAGHNSMHLTMRENSFSLTIKAVFTMAHLWLASSAAFFINNASFYWLSGKFPSPTMAEYLARVSKYYLPSVQKPVFYVLIALVVYIVSFILVTQQREQGVRHDSK